MYMFAFSKYKPKSSDGVTVPKKRPPLPPQQAAAAAAAPRRQRFKPERI
jgi:hypothetical protein